MAPSIKAMIQEALSESRNIRTPIDIVRYIKSKQPHFQTATIRKVLKELLNEGQLIYTHRFAVTQLEPNFYQPLIISSRLRICHAAIGIDRSYGHSAVWLSAGGAAFGAGDHPSTRLALRAIDYSLDQLQRQVPLLQTKVLDIGTGSGVLALAALYLGVGSALAIDVDPLACQEASLNAFLNQFQDRIEIRQTDMENLEASRYHLVMANLRPPTIKRLMSRLSNFTECKGLWIFSGFRWEESQSLSSALKAISAQVIWHRVENDWSAMVLQPKI